jgi:hypothetical protein
MVEEERPPKAKIPDFLIFYLSHQTGAKEL